LPSLQKPTGRFALRPIRQGQIETRYVNTKQNCADMMTKAVSVEVAGATGVGHMLAGLAAFPEIPPPDDSLARF